MYKYIVTWLVIQFVSMPCPDKREANEYGLKNWATSCSALHLQKIVKPMSKEFFDRGEAVAFIKNGEMPSKSYILDHLDEFKLDSIYVEIINSGCTCLATMDSTGNIINEYKCGKHKAK
jgi:hypothetical protein